MLRSIACALIFLAISSAGAAVNTDALHGLGDTRYHNVKADKIGRDYHIYVMLPNGYKESADREYPTVYLLDGGALFPLISAYYRYLNFAEEVPDLMIVGISYGSDTHKGGNYRSTDYTAESSERDYWGGAGAFQSFLGKELMPFIESTYRSDASRRVIFGQSLGGQFVLYTALTEPDLFWGHIASNPALHRNLPFFLKSHAGSGDRPTHLFVASGTDDDPRFREPALEWIRHWSDSTDKPWRLKTTDLQTHSHMSAPPASFRQGMRWLFARE